MKTGAPSESARARKRVAIVYPYFPHYRRAVLRELLDEGRYDYELFGDDRAPSGGIVALTLGHEPRFVRTPCLYLTDSVLLWQRGVIGGVLSRRFDCVVFLGNAAWPATWFAVLAARLMRKRVLFWTHGWTARDRGLKRLLRIGFYRLAHGLLLYGEHARSIALENGLPPQSLHVVYNSLDYEQQREQAQRITFEQRVAKRIELFGAADVPVLLASSRLVPVKQFNLLIEAVGELRRVHGRQAHLLFVGDGPEREALTKQASESGVKAYFVGACYDEASLAALFMCASATVSPGNVGLLCMHSFAYGIPVITHAEAASQGPEWEAIANGLNGELFAKDSVADLMRALEKWTRSAWPSAAASRHCTDAVSSKYHPRVQRVLIEGAIDASVGAPASPLSDGIAPCSQPENQA